EGRRREVAVVVADTAGVGIDVGDTRLGVVVEVEDALGGAGEEGVKLAETVVEDTGDTTPVGGGGFAGTVGLATNVAAAVVEPAGVVEEPLGVAVRVAE